MQDCTYPNVEVQETEVRVVTFYISPQLATVQLFVGLVRISDEKASHEIALTHSQKVTMASPAQRA